MNGYVKLLHWKNSIFFVEGNFKTKLIDQNFDLVSVSAEIRSYMQLFFAVEVIL